MTLALVQYARFIYQCMCTNKHMHPDPMTGTYCMQGSCMHDAWLAWLVEHEPLRQSGPMF